MIRISPHLSSFVLYAMFGAIPIGSLIGVITVVFELPNPLLAMGMGKFGPGLGMMILLTSFVWTTALFPFCYVAALFRLPKRIVFSDACVQVVYRGRTEEFQYAQLTEARIAKETFLLLKFGARKISVEADVGQLSQINRYIPIYDSEAESAKLAARRVEFQNFSGQNVEQAYVLESRLPTKFELNMAGIRCLRTKCAGCGSITAHSIYRTEDRSTTASIGCSECAWLSAISIEEYDELYDLSFEFDELEEGNLSYSKFEDGMSPVVKGCLSRLAQAAEEWKCPQCGSGCPMTVNSCWSCGYERRIEGLEEAEPATVHPFCPLCGHESGPDAMNCEACDRPLDPFGG